MSQVKISKFLLLVLVVLSGLYLSSCSTPSKIDAVYSFYTAIDVTENVENFDQIEFAKLDHLDVGFYEGTVWIKLEISNSNEAQSYVITGNDLINRNYRFYKLDTMNSMIKPVKRIENLNLQDHRTFNHSKPNFKIDLAPNEIATFYVTTQSDGRILQASPKLLTLKDYTTANNHSVLFDTIFYGVIVLLLIINIFLSRILKNKIYYSYGLYIVSSCLMYLFVEGRLYGLELEHDIIDHLMFLSIRLWILSSVLFSFKFLDVKETNPKLFKLVKILLIISLGGTTLYQLIF